LEKEKNDLLQKCGVTQQQFKAMLPLIVAAEEASKLSNQRTCK
jgi:hypothetical protein